MEENYTWKVWSERKIGSLEEGERGGEEKKIGKRRQEGKEAGGIPETDQGKERNIAFSVYSCAFLHVSVPMGRGATTLFHAFRNSYGLSSLF